MKVQQVMSGSPATCSPDDTLARAAQLMWDHDCGILPVTDGDGRVVGVITDRDICMGALMRGLPLHELSVAESMAKEVITCGPFDDIERAERAMHEAKVRRLPVVDEQERIVGVLSVHDLVHAWSGETEAHLKESEAVGILETLGAIGEPWATRSLSAGTAP